MLKIKIQNSFPDALFPEDNIHYFSGPEIVMGCTNFLSCSLSNDSGVSHMLSTNNNPLVKLFGPKDSKKFTLPSSMIHTISASNFGSNDINVIPIKKVIATIENELSVYLK